MVCSLPADVSKLNYSRIPEEDSTDRIHGALSAQAVFTAREHDSDSVRGPLSTLRFVAAIRSTCNGPITIAIRARFEYDSTTIRLRFQRDTTSYEELCAFEQ